VKRLRVYAAVMLSLSDFFLPCSLWGSFYGRVPEVYGCLLIVYPKIRSVIRLVELNPYSVRLS